MARAALRGPEDKRLGRAAGGGNHCAAGIRAGGVRRRGRGTRGRGARRSRAHTHTHTHAPSRRRHLGAPDLVVSVGLFLVWIAQAEGIRALTVGKIGTALESRMVRVLSRAAEEAYADGASVGVEMIEMPGPRAKVAPTEGAGVR